MAHRRAALALRTRSLPCVVGLVACSAVVVASLCLSPVTSFALGSSAATDVVGASRVSASLRATPQPVAAPWVGSRTATFGSLAVAQAVACAVLLRITVAPCKGPKVKKATRVVVASGFQSRVVCTPASPVVLPQQVPVAAGCAAVSAAPVVKPLSFEELLGDARCQAAPQVCQPAPTLKAAPATSPAAEAKAVAPEVSAPRWRCSRAQVIGGVRRACVRRGATAQGRPASTFAAGRQQRRQMGSRIACRAQAPVVQPIAPSFDASRVRMKIQLGIHATSRVRSEQSGTEPRITSATSGTDALDMYIQAGLFVMDSSKASS